MSRRLHRSDQGFTAIELLITLFVAAAFLVAGYQLFFIVIKDNGQTRAQAKAANLAYNFLRQYDGTATAPCSPATPVVNSAQTVSGLTNVTVSVTVTCPYSATTGTNSAINTSRVEVDVTYGNPSQTLQYVNFTNTSPYASSSDITNGLVGYWKLDGSAQASVGVSGSLVAAPTLTTGENGQASGAYSFDGASQYIQIPSTLSLGTTNITISLWVNNPTATNSGGFIKIGGSTGYGIGIGNTTFDNSNPGTKLIALYEAVRWIGTSQNVGTGWHFIAMTMDSSSTPTLYEDGAPIASYAGTAAQAPTGGTMTLASGTGTSSGGRYFKGSIDDARIYSRVLSAQEIQTLYNNGAQ